MYCFSNMRFKKQKKETKKKTKNKTKQNKTKQQQTKQTNKQNKKQTNTKICYEFLHGLYRLFVCFGSFVILFYHFKSISAILFCKVQCMS